LLFIDGPSGPELALFSNQFLPSGCTLRWQRGFQAEPGSSRPLKTRGFAAAAPHYWLAVLGLR